MSDEKSSEKEANTCIALGVGVAALGTVGAAVSGAVCPVCWVAVPALLGTGVIKKIKSKRAQVGTRK